VATTTATVPRRAGWRAGDAGAHINPAVTLAFAARRGFPWRRRCGPALRRERGICDRPARDLGPRVLALFAGWGKVAIPGDYGNVNAYVWIPIVGPMVGGLIGAYVYDLSIRDVLVARGERPADVEQRGRTVEDEA
jgi:glycerol uptake facilitator-like aquaporin